MSINISQVSIFLLTIILGMTGWLGKNIYDSTQILDRRLTIVESTLIDRTEAIKRLAVIEHRLSTLEK